MSHIVSLALTRGQHSTTMRAASLGEVLKFAVRNAPDSKSDCFLMSGAYNTLQSSYHRSEDSFDAVSTAMVDADNAQQDPHLLDKFKDAFHDVYWIVWETASSTPEQPKFRALLPLSTDIPWTISKNGKKLAKEALQQLFYRLPLPSRDLLNDGNASWFYTPTKEKLSSLSTNNAPFYDAENALHLMSVLEDNERQLMEIQQSMSSVREATRQWKKGTQSCDWHYLPSVKKCLAGLAKGERDNSISRACYAMHKNGYAQSVNDFLDEMQAVQMLPPDMLRKFRNRLY